MRTPYFLKMASVVTRVEGSLEFSKLRLDRDLPQRSCADQHGIGARDGSAETRTQARVAMLPPQDDVGIEEEPQSFSPLNADSRSAGRGS